MVVEHLVDGSGRARTEEPTDLVAGVKTVPLGYGADEGDMTSPYSVVVTALGICIIYQVKRPVVTGVALRGTRNHPVAEQAFELKTGSANVADQINDLVRALRSKIASLDLEQCVIKIADQSPKPSNLQAPRNRLMIEGALVFACRDRGILRIQVLNGRDIGTALSCSKDEGMSAGSNLVAKQAGAASAALAALTD